MLEIVGYRWAGYDTPLWAGPNRSPARWHGPGSPPTQYWALHPLGPWAEYVRTHDILDPADLADITSRTWAARFGFEDDAVAAISFENASTWDIAPSELVGDDQDACRRLSDRLRKSYRAAVVPSAALPGTDNLLVFGAGVLAPYGAAPVYSGLDVPAAVTADRGRPPAAVLDLVCRRGDRHAGLAAWENDGTLLPAPNPVYSALP